MRINFKKTCEEKGITSFSRTRGGWMKLVEGLDKTQNGGYSFIGDMFFKVGNFETNIPTGLFLDQSTSIVDGKKVFTMNLFKVNKGDVELVNTTPKTNGWATKFWDDVDEYYKDDDVSISDDIIEAIYEMTHDPKIIDEVIRKLEFKQVKEEQMYKFRNWHEVLSHLIDANVQYTPVKFWDDIPEDNPLNVDFCIKEAHISYALRKYITKQLNLVIQHYDNCNYELTENTPVDYQRISPRVMTTTETFKRMLTLYKDVFFLAHTLPNNTGYHNRVEVVIYWYDDGQVFIRSFDYFINTCKRDQLPADYMGRNVE